MRPFDDFELQPIAEKRRCKFPPLVSTGVSILVIVLHVLYLWNLFALVAVDSCAGPVLELGQVYRLASSLFIHTTWMHLALVGLPFTYVSFKLEKRLGSLCFTILFWFVGLSSSVLHAFFEWLLYKMFHDVSFLVHCSCGLSGTCLCLSLFYWGRPAQPSKPEGLVLYGFLSLLMACVLLPGPILSHLSGSLLGFLCLLRFRLPGFLSSGNARGSCLQFFFGPCRRIIEALEEGEGLVEMMVDFFEPCYVKCTSSEETLLMEEARAAGRKESKI